MLVKHGALFLASVCVSALSLKGSPLICIASSCVFLKSSVSPDFRSSDCYSLSCFSATFHIGGRAFGSAELSFLFGGISLFFFNGVQYDRALYVTRGEVC